MARLNTLNLNFAPRTHEGALARHVSPELQLRRSVLACLLLGEPVLRGRSRDRWPNRRTGAEGCSREGRGPCGRGSRADEAASRAASACP